MHDTAKVPGTRDEGRPAPRSVVDEELADPLLGNAQGSGGVVGTLAMRRVACFRVAQRGRRIGMLFECPLDAAEQAAAGRLLRRADTANAPREAALLASARLHRVVPAMSSNTWLSAPGYGFIGYEIASAAFFSRLPALACLERVRAH